MQLLKLPCLAFGVNELHHCFQVDSLEVLDQSNATLCHCTVQVRDNVTKRVTVIDKLSAAILKVKHWNKNLDNEIFGGSKSLYFLD